MQSGEKPKGPINLNNPYFSTDIKDLFSQRRFSHVGNWRFSKPKFEGDIVNGLGLWNDMSKRAKENGLYYIFSDEIELLKICAPELKKLLPQRLILVDLGPGSKEAVKDKIGTLITGLDKRVMHYTAIDLVPEILQSTKQFFNQTFKNITFSSFHKDFFSESFDLKGHPSKLFVLLGLTMFNIAIDPRDKDLSIEMLLSMLKNLRSNMNTGEHLIVTQDCNSDLQTMYDLYYEQYEVWMNLLYRIKRDLLIHRGFDPEAFSFAPEWFDSTNVSVRTFTAKKGMKFQIDKEDFDIRQGQKFFLHNSYKFPTSEFLDYTRKAKFSPIFSKKNDKGRMALHLLEAL